MTVPARSSGFPDILSAEFAKIFDDRYKQLPDRVGEFYSIVGAEDTPRKDSYRTSEVGTFGDLSEFTGTVTYDDVSEGYDTTITPKEYSSGFQLERKLHDDGMYGVMNAKPKQLALAVQRTRQKHAAQPFNNAFSVDTTWRTGGDAVALCSDSHTTRSGASTAAGFDNLITAALSSVSVVAARLQMRGFRGDRAERISVMPSHILVPPDLEDIAWEIVHSMGKLDTANNNANFNKGRYQVKDWEYLSDTNNWFMYDAELLKDSFTWFERLAAEFAQVEDFDSITGKWRVYGRWGNGHGDWRSILGAQVS